MRDNEAAARALVAQLNAAHIEAHVRGAGVHWQVDVGPVASRALRVHCFWYERAISGSRSPPYEGPEYLVILRDDRGRVADGRTHIGADVVRCAQSWLVRVELEQLVREVPFIDEKPRAMRALAERLDPGLRWEIGEEPACELWVYGEGRSCCVTASGKTIACRFMLGQAQVAHAPALDDVPTAIAVWIGNGVSVRALATHVPSVDLERHAEVLETDPARWHWLHVRDRIADPRDVLAPLRELIETLAASPVVTRFFSYSSHNRLCFSASSHYPWVDYGLPVVAPTEHGGYAIGSTRCDLGRAVDLVEATLAASPIRPFFGSAPHHELPSLSECLVRQGSPLSPHLAQHGAWYELVIADRTGTRRCTVSGPHVVFIDGTSQLNASWATLDDAVRAIRRFCEEGASFAELAADPRAQFIARRAP